MWGILRLNYVSSTISWVCEFISDFCMSTICYCCVKGVMRCVNLCQWDNRENNIRLIENHEDPYKCINIVKDVYLQLLKVVEKYS